MHAVAEPPAPPAAPTATPPAGTPVAAPGTSAVPAVVDGDDDQGAARARAAERGVLPADPTTTTLWTFLATVTGGRAVVEIGTGVGVGTVALLRGMAPEGLLTGIDVDPEHQRLTRHACTEAGFGPGRVRLITGRALDVLPRLSDGAYDLVVVDALTAEYPAYLAAAVPLLRPGGVVALDRARGEHHVSDPVRRDAAAGALRETVRLVREDERLAPIMLPLADGTLCAARR